MIKKVLITTLFLTICTLSMTACTTTLPYYEKVNTAVTLSEQIMNLYDEQLISIGELIDSVNVSDYCSEDEEMYKILNSNNESHNYYVCVIDECTVLIKTNIIFNAVEGYIITTDEHNLPNTINVPKSLGFNGNSASVVELDDKYPNVYTFRAKL